MLGMLILGCGSKLPTAQISVDGNKIHVEIAATKASRAQGLMHRDHLADNRGMLFIYPRQEPLSFWMKDTRIPLSIAFADKSGKIVKIIDMTAFKTESVKSLYPATYALEMNQGWFDEREIAKGAMLTDLPTDITPE
jgi:uncharacterized protein